MSTLYEMTQQAKMLYEMMQQEEIDEKAYFDTLDAMGTGEKVESYCKVIKQLQADTDMFDKEIKRLEAKKKAIENNIERMKSTLKNYLFATNNENIKTGTFSVYISTSKKVNITNIEKLPVIYLVEQPPQVDKQALKKAIEDGAKIEGAEIITNKNIVIR